MSYSKRFKMITVCALLTFMIMSQAISAYGIGREDSSRSSQTASGLETQKSKVSHSNEIFDSNKALHDAYAGQQGLKKFDKETDYFKSESCMKLSSGVSELVNQTTSFDGIGQMLPENLSKAEYKNLKKIEKVKGFGNAVSSSDLSTGSTILGKTKPYEGNILFSRYEEIFSQELSDLKGSKNSERSNDEEKEIIVKYKSIKESDKVKKYVKKSLSLEDKQFVSKSKVLGGKIELIRLGSEKQADLALTQLKNNPKVEYAEKNYKINVSNTLTSPITNDPEVINQWGLYNVGKQVHGIKRIDINPTHLKDGTEVTGAGTTVAIIDSYVDITHEDLKDNIYVNEKEIPGNGIDDDGNGYIDDINGWDFKNNCPLTGENKDGDIHGTHVAGIIAASANNQKGICGVAPKAKILPLRFLSDAEGGTTMGAIMAIDYAKSMGVKIANCSWGSMSESLALKEIMRDSGILFLCAAGNLGMDTKDIRSYPASFDLPNIVSVASINNKGFLSYFSSYGDKVHVAAPGEDIISTVPGNKYAYLSGTSMAAPFVSGMAAVLCQRHPNELIGTIASRIKDSAFTVSQLDNKVVSSGIADINAAMLGSCSKKDSPTINSVKKYEQGVEIQWNKVPGATNYQLEINRGAEIKALGSNPAYKAEGLTDYSDYGMYRIRSIGKNGIPSKWSPCVFARPEAPADQVLDIPDWRFKTALMNSAGIYPGSKLLKVDAENTDKIIAPSGGIKNIEGIQAFKNVKKVVLDGNMVSNISPISSLKNLEELYAGGNFAEDISSLSHLVNLRILELDANGIVDLSPLENLQKLEVLSAQFNRILNVDNVSNLINLQYLLLGFNNIRQIEGLQKICDSSKLIGIGLSFNELPYVPDLSNLKELKYLVLWGNNITDVSKLKNMTSLESLLLGYNKLESLDWFTEFSGSKLKYLDLSDNNISTVPDLSNLGNLELLDLGFNGVADISNLKNLKNLKVISAAGNKISDIECIKDFSCAQNLIALIFSFNNISSVPDLSGMTNLVTLLLRNNKVSNLCSLSELSHLEFLDLASNGIESLKWLEDSKFPRLKYIFADNNKIASIPNLSNSPEVEYLFLYGNEINDVSGLSSCKNLKFLSLAENKIQDISSMANIDESELIAIELSYNQLSTIPDLSNMKKLQSMFISNNKLENIDGLSNCKDLNMLDASYNHISNIRKLGEGSLQELVFLVLHNNDISDISTIGGLENLCYLVLNNNKITNISSIDKLSNLMLLDLSVNQIQNINVLSNIKDSKMYFMKTCDNKITKIPDLSNLSNIRYLIMSDNKIKSCKGLDKLGNLMGLDLDNNEISSLSELKELTNLTYLSLNSNKIKDIKDLCDLYKLVELNLGSNQITSVKSLASSSQLYWLDLSNNRIKNLNEWKDCAFRLNTLDLGGNRLTDESTGILAGLENLFILNLADNKISSISDLNKITNLSGLCLKNNNIINFPYMDNLQSLYLLNMEGNKIRSIEGLSNLTDLVELNLGYNQIMSIDGLRNMKSLVSLDLSNNRIKDINLLGNMTMLGELCLNDNQISDISALRGLRCLWKLMLANNKITDFSPVEDYYNNLSEKDFELAV